MAPGQLCTVNTCNDGSITNNRVNTYNSVSTGPVWPKFVKGGHNHNQCALAPTSTFEKPHFPTVSILLIMLLFPNFMFDICVTQLKKVPVVKTMPFFQNDLKIRKYVERVVFARIAI